MELEKTLMEERRLEESLRKQRESNEQRFEEEQRIIREKLEREQRKQDMMRAAIEKARQEAEMERAKKKRSSHSISECESPTQNGEHSHIPPEIPNSNRTEPSQSPIPPDSDEMQYNEDDEKILIGNFRNNNYVIVNNNLQNFQIQGTPIRMKKKTLNKSYKVPVSVKKEAPGQMDKEPVATPEINVDGIALVLQKLPPVMPFLSNDIINLNQNINNLNTSNIQLAVMLAHQMQHLSNIAQNQPPVSLNNKINAQETNVTEEKQVTSTQNDNDCMTSNEVCKQCIGGFNQRDSTKQEKTVSF